MKVAVLKDSFRNCDKTPASVFEVGLLHRNHFTFQKDYANKTYHIPTSLYFLGCPLSIELSDLHDNMTCQITDSCTGVKCCVYTKELDRNFDINVILDPCDQSLSLSIDHLVNNVSLYDLGFGEYCTKITTKRHFIIHRQNILVRFSLFSHDFCLNQAFEFCDRLFVKFM